MSGEVRWLYPGADRDQEVSDPEMESELQTDQSVQGSSRNLSNTDKSSPTASGPDSGPGSPVQDLPLDQLSSSVAAASTYVGSFFNPAAWAGQEKEKDEKVEKVKEEKSGGVMAGGIGMMSSAFGRMPGFGKAAPAAEEAPEERREKGGYFSTTALTAGLTSITSSLTMDNLYSATGATTAQEQEEEGDTEAGEVKEDWGVASFTDAFSKVGKMTSGYTKVLQETVSKAPLISDFNQEQEQFIQSRPGGEQQSAPWTGYQGEGQLRENILQLSEDKRNFLRAPPQGVDFDFEYSAVAAHAVVLLEEDPRLSTMRYELVPKKVKEDDFWRNYFYRVGLAKQSFELAASLSAGPAAAPRLPRPLEEDSEAGLASSGGELEEEFVSELHQASSKDMAEADEAMKKLGLTKNDAEWEAELEGELNEYEMVGGEDGEELSEEQIQAMLEAEK